MQRFIRHCHRSSALPCVWVDFLLAALVLLSLVVGLHTRWRELPKLVTDHGLSNLRLERKWCYKSCTLISGWVAHTRWRELPKPVIDHGLSNLRLERKWCYKSCTLISGWIACTRWRGRLYPVTLWVLISATKYKRRWERTWNMRVRVRVCVCVCACAVAYACWSLQVQAPALLVGLLSDVFLTLACCFWSADS